MTEIDPEPYDVLDHLIDVEDIDDPEPQPKPQGATVTDPKPDPKPVDPERDYVRKLFPPKPPEREEGEDDAHYFARRLFHDARND